MWLGAAGEIGIGTNRSANFGRALPITTTRTKIGLDTGARQRHGYFDGLGTAPRGMPSISHLPSCNPRRRTTIPAICASPRFSLRRHLAGSQPANTTDHIERRPKWLQSISEPRAGVALRLAASSSSRTATWRPSSRSLTTSAYVETDSCRDHRGNRAVCEWEDTKTLESRLSSTAPTPSAASPSSPGRCSPLSLSRSSPAARAPVPSRRPGRPPVSSRSGPRATGRRSSCSRSAASRSPTSTASRSCG